MGGSEDCADDCESSSWYDLEWWTKETWDDSCSSQPSKRQRQETWNQDEHWDKSGSWFTCDSWSYSADWETSASWSMSQRGEDGGNDVESGEWEVLGKPRHQLAAVRFIVLTADPPVPEGSRKDAATVQGAVASTGTVALPTGPERLRVVGAGEAFGDWDTHLGLDLFWEGTQWESTLINVLPDTDIAFCLLHIQDAEDLLGIHPYEAQERRRFAWEPSVTLRSPTAGNVLEVTLALSQSGSPRSVATLPRSDCVIQTREDLSRRLKQHREGSQRNYVFDGPNNVTIDFCLYLPPGFSQSRMLWPLLVFLHAMHSRLDGDVNLFFESEAPPQLLLGTPFGKEQCPELLRSSFVVLSPQCPRDPQAAQGSGVWFRRDWYGEASFAAEVVDDLASLIEMMTAHPRMDCGFVALTGTSMGGMGCLEFASRRPGLIKACAPVAAHYEFGLDGLVERLTQDQELPLWFFHAFEDTLCPFETVSELVEKLRKHSRAEVRFTDYHDTWSYTGHCADRVSYQVASRSEGQLALGNELFAWILEQRQ